MGSQTQYQEINNYILSTIELFKAGVEPNTQKDHEIISAALDNFQVLTPIYKNIGRNDILIAQGILERIDRNLNSQLLRYLERTQSENAIINKLGETLQLLEINHIHPKVDFRYESDEKEWVEYNFQEIFADRSVNNTLQKSFSYRKFYLSRIDLRIQTAEDLILQINDLLSSM